MQNILISINILIVVFFRADFFLHHVSVFNTESSYQRGERNTVIQ